MNFGKNLVVLTGLILVSISLIHYHLHVAELKSLNGAWDEVKDELSPTLGHGGRLPSKIIQFARSLSQIEFSKVPVASKLVLGEDSPFPQNVAVPSGSKYAAGYPKSYFDSAPNPDAKFVWVCPGPSLLEDYNTGACPLSKTGEFRCCIDSSNGAAVMNDMCCPQKEVQMRAVPKIPSKTMITQHLANALEDTATRIQERRQALMHPPQDHPVSYLNSADSRKDIDSYFNALSSGRPSEHALPSLAARKDLSSFFNVLGKGTLAGLEPTVSALEPVTKGPSLDRNLIIAAAGELANALRDSISQRAARRRTHRFETWRQRSEAPEHRRPGVMSRLAMEEARQRAASDASFAPRRPVGSSLKQRGGSTGRLSARGVDIPANEVRIA